MKQIKQPPPKGKTPFLLFITIFMTTVTTYLYSNTLGDPFGFGPSSTVRGWPRPFVRCLEACQMDGIGFGQSFLFWAAVILVLYFGYRLTASRQN